MLWEYINNLIRVGADTIGCDDVNVYISVQGLGEAPVSLNSADVRRNNHGVERRGNSAPRL